MSSNHPRAAQRTPSTPLSPRGKIEGEIRATGAGVTPAPTRVGYPIPPTPRGNSTSVSAGWTTGFVSRTCGQLRTTLSAGC